MIARINQKRNNEEGFTLVELLVVIVILGILASIVVFAVGGITDKGSNAASATDESVLSSGQETYFAQNGVYTNEAGLVTAKLLHSVSTHKDVCLSNAVPAVVGPPAVAAIPANMDYRIVAQGTATVPTACPAGFTAAP